MTIAVLIIILILAALIIFTPVEAGILYDKKFKFCVSIAGINIFSSEKDKKVNKLNEAEKTEKKAEENDKFKITIGKVLELLRFIRRYVFKKITVKLFHLSYKFGFDDAAATGVYAGTVYSLVYSIDSYIMNNFKVKDRQISITPDFDNKQNDISVSLSLKISVFCLIVVFLKGIKILYNK